MTLDVSPQRIAAHSANLDRVGDRIGDAHGAVESAQLDRSTITTAYGLFVTPFIWSDLTDAQDGVRDSMNLARRRLGELGDALGRFVADVGDADAAGAKRLAATGTRLPDPDGVRAPRDLSKDADLTTTVDHGVTYTADVPWWAVATNPMGLSALPWMALRGGMSGADVPVGLRKGPDGEEYKASWWDGAGAVGDVYEKYRAADGWDPSVGLAIAMAAPDVADPIDFLLDIGLGWVIDHLEPIPTHLDMFAGDPHAIEAAGETWKNVGNELKNLSIDLVGLAYRDLSEQVARALAAYRDALSGVVAGLDVLGGACIRLADLMTKLAKAVEIVRGILRDIVLELAKLLAKILLRALGNPLSAMRTAKGLIGTTARAVEKVMNDFLPRVDTTARFMREIRGIAVQDVPLIIGENLITGLSGG